MSKKYISKQTEDQDLSSSVLEKVNFDYSLKNIPICGHKEYTKKLLHQTDKFIRNLRWRTFFYLNPKAKSNEKKTYGFNSYNNPPSIPELKQFEDGLISIVKNVQFRQVKNTFQNKIREDTKNIKKDSNLFVPADKTHNFYKLTKEQYNHLLDKEIQKEYKKTNISYTDEITLKDKQIAHNLNLEDRINVTSDREAYITLKDHKDNFTNKPTCRLINPRKTEIGIISREILREIIYSIKSKTNLCQWTKTTDVTSWFDKIENKYKKSFIIFDICNFYPSITPNLLRKALDFASIYNKITAEEKEIILHSKNAALYNNGQHWHKINSPFDVTMGSYDGAETCELVGLYLLSQLKDLKIEIGLYRDDGLAVCNATPRQTENIKKHICKIFEKNELKITIEANKKIIHFLDIKLDIRTKQYEPHKKPNDITKYIHILSNHPPSIKKNIKKSIEIRISNNSSTKEIFNRASITYNEALKESGFKETLTFNENKTPETKEKRKRKRKITWFNPPFSQNVATKIGKKFFQLLNNCFPKTNKLNKIINKNTIKLSYSCMKNIETIIASHNKKILNTHEKEPGAKQTSTDLCNCRNKDSCPLKNECLQKSVIYEAKVTQDSTENTYIGVTENTFKTRYNAHTSSFKLPHKRNDTTLSEHVWDLKESGKQFTIDWKIISKAHPYNTSSKTCNLCLEESFQIITKKPSLNKNLDLLKCPHRRKYLLTNFKEKNHDNPREYPISELQKRANKNSDEDLRRGNTPHFTEDSQ